MPHTNNTTMNTEDTSSLLNNTLPPEMVFGEAQIISISLYTPLFLISSILNLRVLRKLLQTKRRNGLSRLNQLLMHLVLADLSVTFLMMPLEIVWAMTVSWWAGDFACRMCSFFRIFGLFLSSNIVICISIDRFLAILKPFSVRRSSRRIKLMILTAWGLAIILSLPQTLVFNVKQHPKFEWYEQCVTIFFESSSREYEFIYFFMGMIFLYILPLIVIVVTYGGIIWHLHKKCRGTTLNITNNTLDPVWRKDLEFDDDLTSAAFYKKMTKSQNGIKSISSPPSNILLEYKNHFWSRKSSSEIPARHGTTSISSLQIERVVELEMRRTNPGMIGKAKLNTIKITIALVGAFLACWTPYYVICIWFWVAPDQFEQIDYSIRKFLFLFACTNSCANPLIYGLFADKKASIFNSRERICFLPNGRRKKWRNNPLPMDGMNEDDMELEVHKSKDERPSRSCPGSPTRTFHHHRKSRTIFRTELHYKLKSFHGRTTTRYDDSLAQWRRSMSVPNFMGVSSTKSDRPSPNKDEYTNVITEVHMRTNDISMLKVI